MPKKWREKVFQDAHCKLSAVDVGTRLRRVFLSVLNEAVKAAEYLSGVADENKKWGWCKVGKSREERAKQCSWWIGGSRGFVVVSSLIQL